MEKFYYKNSLYFVIVMILKFIILDEVYMLKGKSWSKAAKVANLYHHQADYFNNIVDIQL